MMTMSEIIVKLAVVGLGMFKCLLWMAGVIVGCMVAVFGYWFIRLLIMEIGTAIDVWRWNKAHKNDKPRYISGERR